MFFDSKIWQFRSILTVFLNLNLKLLLEIQISNILNEFFWILEIQIQIFR